MWCSVPTSQSSPHLTGLDNFLWFWRHQPPINAGGRLDVQSAPDHLIVRFSSRPSCLDSWDLREEKVMPWGGYTGDSMGHLLVCSNGVLVESPGQLLHGLLVKPHPILVHASPEWSGHEVPVSQPHGSTLSNAALSVAMVR